MEDRIRRIQTNQIIQGRAKNPEPPKIEGALEIKLSCKVIKDDTKHTQFEGVNTEGLIVKS